jgi:hypothetical protein
MVSGSGGVGRCGADVKIVLTFCFSGGDKNAIVNAGLEWFGARACDGGIHAADCLAVNKLINVIGA